MSGRQIALFVEGHQESIDGVQVNWNATKAAIEKAHSMDEARLGKWRVTGTRLPVSSRRAPVRRQYLAPIEKT